MTPIDFLSSFTVATLSGLGVGGGGIFVIYLSLFTSTPQLTAQGLNLLFFLFSCSSSLSIHLFRRKIYFRRILIMIALGIPGAILGSYLSRVINENILRKIFGIIVTISGFLTLFGPSKRSKKEKSI